MDFGVEVKFALIALQVRKSVYAWFSLVYYCKSINLNYAKPMAIKEIRDWQKVLSGNIWLQDVHCIMIITAWMDSAMYFYNCLVIQNNIGSKRQHRNSGFRNCLPQPKRGIISFKMIEISEYVTLMHLKCLLRDIV